MEQTDRFDVAVVGAGPAGLVAATRAARRGAHVILMDRQQSPGRKIALSGGGRCNILPRAVDTNSYVTDGSRNTLRKILLSWPLPEVREFLERDAGIRLREMGAPARIYPASQSGEDVRRRLLAAAQTAGAVLRVNAMVPQLDPGSRHTVHVRNRKPVYADRVVLATGGRSYAATGSDGVGFDIAASVGHTIVRPYPALVPLYGGPSTHHDLAGVSVDVLLTVTDGGRCATSAGSLLFTHKGYSGPAVLNVAHCVGRAVHEGRSPTITVSWGRLTEEDWISKLSTSRPFGVRRALRDVLPDRLSVCLLTELGLQDAQISSLTDDDRRRLIRTLSAYPLRCGATGGFGEAEVTGGGVPLSEVDSRTLESRIVPRLFFCGEMLDAFGPIGGANFLWAFVTGKVAGDAAAVRPASNT